MEYVYRYMGIEVTPQSVYQSCDFQEGDLGMSLSQVKDALEQKGLYCLGFKAPLKSLTRPEFSGCCFIIWSPGKKIGHFDVIVKSKTANLWLLIDPSSKSVYPIENVETNSRSTILLAVSKEIISFGNEKSYKWIIDASIVFVAVSTALSFIFFLIHRRRRACHVDVTHN